MTDAPPPQPNRLFFIAMAVLAVVVAVVALVVVFTIPRRTSPGDVVTRFYDATSCAAIHDRVTDALWTSDYRQCDDKQVAAEASGISVRVISTSTNGNTATVDAEVTSDGAATGQPPSSSEVQLTLVKVSGKWKVQSDRPAPVDH